MTTAHMVLVAKLKAKARAEGGPRFHGKPDRWWNNVTVRCAGDDVSTRYLKTDNGDRCLACGQAVTLTFPEDRDGVLKVGGT